MGETAANPFRLLPKVDELLDGPDLADLATGPRRALVHELATAVLDDARERVRAGDLDADGVASWVRSGGPAEAVRARVRLEDGRGVVRVVNATGVVLNTGLGRAPVHPEVAAAMAAAAESYCVLEVDRFTGRRNRRDERLGVLAGRLLGCEAAIAVNNCAAAVLLTLSTFAGGRQCVLSRGELVEIGGAFRMPDVMERANARLVEVGTTNRTRIADYERVLGPEVGLLLKVHTSNFRVVGFVEEVGPGDLARMGAEHGIPTAFDLGSGLVDPPGARPLDFLGDEPPVRAALASGVDVVMFSGDKLLGAPQAGILCGKQSAIDALRANPLYRALRLDKVALAGLEQTFELLLRGRGDELPARALLLRTADELASVAERLASALNALDAVTAEVVPERSQPGSGSAPDVFLDTWCVRVAVRGRTPDRLATSLRAGDPCVFARITADAVHLDPRTLLDGDEARLVEAFRSLSAGA